MLPLTTERRVAIALALFRTIFCGWRAWRQSFALDEAFTFNAFTRPSWHDLYFKYDANNHLLFSVLSRISMLTFGDSEFALRLPSVLGGLLLMLAVWGVLEFVSSPVARWVAFVAIGLNPLILDFSVAARGYGLANALLVCGLLAAMHKRWAASGLVLGFAVAANFTVAFPALGLIAAVFALNRFRSAATMGVLAVLPVTAMCAGVVPLLGLGHFYVGYSSLTDSVHNLVYSSIFQLRNPGLFGTWEAAVFLSFRALPVMILFIGVVSVLVWRTRDASAFCQRWLSRLHAWVS